jgi:DNA-binding MarR family transcriptional regulator
MKDEAAARVLRQFRQVFNAVKTHFQQVEKSAGVGGAQVWALSIVSGHPGIGVGELARTMDVHQSTASNLVKVLNERKLLRVERAADDRRAVRLHLTAAGGRILRKAPTPFSGVLPQALAALDERTLRRLYADLDALLSVLHTDRRAARTPLADL